MSEAPKIRICTDSMEDILADRAGQGWKAIFAVLVNREGELWVAMAHELRQMPDDYKDWLSAFAGTAMREVLLRPLEDVGPVK